MNPWPFVIAAYLIATALTSALLVIAFISMRRAESALEVMPKR